MTGGIGRAKLSKFYLHHFIFQNPADTNLELISRTVGVDRVVDEFICHMTHNMQIDWMYVRGLSPLSVWMLIEQDPWHPTHRQTPARPLHGGGQYPRRPALPRAYCLGPSDGAGAAGPDAAVSAVSVCAGRWELARPGQEVRVSRPGGGGRVCEQTAERASGGVEWDVRVWSPGGGRVCKESLKPDAGCVEYGVDLVQSGLHPVQPCVRQSKSWSMQTPVLPRFPPLINRSSLVVSCELVCQRHQVKMLRTAIVTGSARGM